MPKSVRLSDIAGQVGVSTVTVSKALAGKKGVSEDLRLKIQETADRMGYEQPSSAESRQRQDAGRNIGILAQTRYFQDTTTMYWEFHRLLLGFLREEGRYGILEIILPEDEKNMIPPRLFEEKKTGGVIVLGNLEQDYRRLVAALAQKDALPLVFLDSDEGDTGNTCVISDGYYGMYTVTKHLIEMGHRNILFVGSTGSTSSIFDRYYGYCRAMRENGLEALEPMPDRDETGAPQFTLPESLPTAFACNCDLTAARLITLLKERNLEIPGDISIAGFDGFLFPGYARVPLTTWVVDMDAMTRTSVHVVTGKIHLAQPSTLVICGHLAVRDSVRRQSPIPSRRPR
jgi:DNA-binding LacI/PurR family transcriptional regulator